MDTKSKLSTIWILVVLNMIFADILSIYIEFVQGGAINIIGDSVETTMAIAAVIINIPIFMILLSRALKYKVNRMLNIVSAVLTAVFVIAGGSTLPHYVIMATIEIALLLAIISISWRWKPSEK